MSDREEAREAIRQLKARYCRLLDTKDYEGYLEEGVRPDVVVALDMAIAVGGADGQTAPR